MTASGRSEQFVKTLFLAAVAAFALAVVPGSAAQVNGVPASVSSIGFGGNFNSHPGVPASVTSIGPHGFGFNPQLFTQQQFNQPFHGNEHFPHHQHHQGFFPGGIPVVAVPYGIPYAYPVEVPVEVQDESQAEEYNGGPTIFDRRGPGTSNRHDEERYRDRREDSEAEHESSSVGQPSTDEPVASQPDTHIVFKDGRAVDVSNYAIIGATLYDLTPGHPRKIAISDIDVSATEKQNEDRGVDFHVPAT